MKKHSELLTHKVPITTQESVIRFVIFDAHHKGLYIFVNIGITYGFSCNNICWVPRKVFELEADRLSAQTSPKGPSKCKCNETNMCDPYSCIFYLIPTQFALKTLLKHWNIHFLTQNFSKQNGVLCQLSNVITLPQRHSRTQRFRKQKHWQNDKSGLQRFLHITSC